MRKYTLAASSSKEKVDLRDYAAVIAEAVQEVMPGATVTVEQSCYYVTPTPKPGDARKIGRQICKSDLSQYCIQIPKLFCSVEIQEVNNESREEPKHPGGHH